ncbi:MAG TPA: RNA polymerase sigma factor, partial [Bryobacteraceae bacterium]
LSVAVLYVLGSVAAWRLARRGVAQAGRPFGFRHLTAAMVIATAGMTGMTYAGRIANRWGLVRKSCRDCLPVLKVKSATPGQFEEVLRRYIPALRRLAWSYTRNTTECDDLFQEINVALWRALPRFRQDSSERTYVYRVAHNTAINFVTADRRREAREYSGELVVEPAGPDDPEQDAIRNQRRLRLRDAVQELPVNDRQIVLLYLEGLSAAEIETVTGFSAGSIATRLTRARHRLAAQFYPGGKI